jgi:hypothetical protein
MRTSLGSLLVSVTIESPSSGWLTVTGNQMTGKINGMNVANVTLRKQ